MCLHTTFLYIEEPNKYYIYLTLIIKYYIFMSFNFG